MSELDLPPHFTLLQVVPELNAGGVEQTTLDISKAVVAAGGRSIIASKGGRLEEALKASGGELVRLPIESKNPLIQMSNRLGLEALIKREGISLVHVRSRAPAFAAIDAAKAAGVPSVATYHGVYNAKSDLKRWYNSIMTKADRVIANSDYTRRHLIDAHGTAPSKVTTVDRGTDLSRFDPEQVSDERIYDLLQQWGIAYDDPRPRLLLAGRLTHWKGQTLAIEMLAKAREIGAPEALLILAGDAQGRLDYVETLKELAEDHGVSDRVLIVGHCADMPAAYLACDIALSPSLDPEAFGRTVVEPQIMGRPVMASAHGAPRDTVLDTQTGWLIAPNRADLWAEVLWQALDLGPEGRNVMGKIGRERATSLYSAEAMCKKTLGVYVEVLTQFRNQAKVA